MDLKIFKQDLIYCIKKLVSDGKVLVYDCDNLDIETNLGVSKFVSLTNFLHPTEMLCLIKDFKPTFEMIRSYQKYNFNISEVFIKEYDIPELQLYAFYEGFEGRELEPNSNYDLLFWNLGGFIADKFKPLGYKKELIPCAKKQYKEDYSTGPSQKRFIIEHNRKNIEIKEVLFTPVNIPLKPNCRFLIDLGVDKKTDFYRYHEGYASLEKAINEVKKYNHEPDLMNKIKISYYKNKD